MKAAKYPTPDTPAALQALETKASRGPGPGSVIIPPADDPVNVCPACLAQGRKVPCSPFPYACATCGWTAATDSRGCWLRVREVLTDGTEYAYDVTSDAGDAELLTPEERNLWKAEQAKAGELGNGPPEWAPAKGLDR